MVCYRMPSQAIYPKIERALHADVSAVPHSNLPMMKAATLAVERAGDGSIWLCANDRISSKPLARFESEQAALHFTDLFALARSVFRPGPVWHLKINS